MQAQQYFNGYKVERQGNEVVLLLVPAGGINALRVPLEPEDARSIAEDLKFTADLVEEKS